MTHVKFFPNRYNTMDRSINEFVDRFFDAGFAGDSVRHMPAADVVEKDNVYLITMEVPGLSKDDVRIALEKDILTISGEKKLEQVEGDKERYHIRERKYGAFERKFRIPNDVDVNKINAEFTNGVLTMTLEKAEEKQPREIAIKAK
jgi:HSP20 family protein